MEPYHEPAWDGVYGVVEEDQSEDLDETHPYLVRCDFPHQSVPMHRCMWFSAWELVEPTTAERIDQLRKCGAWPWPGDEPKVAQAPISCTRRPFR